MRKLLKWVADRYLGTAILITENGVVDPVDAEDPLSDASRIQYLRGYLDAIWKSIETDGVNVLGYFVWSLTDNVEWSDGWKDRFGFFRVEGGGASGKALARTPKASVAWFSRTARSWPTRPTLHAGEGYSAKRQGRKGESEESRKKSEGVDKSPSKKRNQRKKTREPHLTGLMRPNKTN
jgi:hypothetical protein